MHNSWIPSMDGERKKSIKIVSEILSSVVARKRLDQLPVFMTHHRYLIEEREFIPVIMWLIVDRLNRGSSLGVISWLRISPAVLLSWSFIGMGCVGRAINYLRPIPWELPFRQTPWLQNSIVIAWGTLLVSSSFSGRLPVEYAHSNHKAWAWLVHSNSSQRIDIPDFQFKFQINSCFCFLSLCSFFMFITCSDSMSLSYKVYSVENWTVIWEIWNVGLTCEVQTPRKCEIDTSVPERGAIVSVREQL